MNEKLVIVQHLRRYIRAMGIRPTPIAVTHAQAEQLKQYHRLELRGAPESAERARLWFEGQELRTHGDTPPRDSELPPDPPAVVAVELRARDTDPETSHIALASFNPNGRAMQCLRGLLEHGDGNTVAIAAFIGKPRENWSPVFCKLVDAGLAVVTHAEPAPPGSGQGPRMVYAITDRGRAHLLQIALELET